MKKSETKKITVSGMHCEHCAARVTQALEKIKGVHADVDPALGIAIVQLGREVTDKALCEAIENVGFTVINIE